MYYMKKILIVGFGSIGKRHLKNILKHTPYEVIILTKRQDIGIKNKRVKTFKNLQECLSEKPHIAFITNETAYHVNTSIELAKRGLDLFIEKPLSHSSKGTKTLQKIIKQKKLINYLNKKKLVK